MQMLFRAAALLGASLCLGAAAPALAAGSGAADAMRDGHDPLVHLVLRANARFLDVKAAVAEGYAPIPCASGVAGGAMGIHYVNADYLKDDAVDLARPEAVMYEPQADGRLELVGVEYITFKGPASLQGQLFNFTGAPNRYGLPAFYELHVWAWRQNRSGPFADMNPNVSCAAADADGAGQPGTGGRAPR